MFAVIKTGGKQYRVAPDDLIEVDKIAGAAGDAVAFAEVLAVGGDEVVLGTPVVVGATVRGEVVEQGRQPKVIAFKKRRRKNSRRKRGHRQEFTRVRIIEILASGKPDQSKSAKPKPEPQAAATTAAAPKPDAEPAAATAPAATAQPEVEADTAPAAPAPQKPKAKADAAPAAAPDEGRGSDAEAAAGTPRADAKTPRDAAPVKNTSSEDKTK